MPDMKLLMSTHVYFPGINWALASIEILIAKLAAVARGFANACSSPEYALQLAALEHSLLKSSA
jgi:hypothetical protein